MPSTRICVSLTITLIATTTLFSGGTAAYAQDAPPYPPPNVCTPIPFPLAGLDPDNRLVGQMNDSGDGNGTRLINRLCYGGPASGWAEKKLLTKITRAFGVNISVLCNWLCLNERAQAEAWQPVGRLPSPAAVQALVAKLRRRRRLFSPTHHSDLSSNHGFTEDR
jgi:hypothetical protein